MKSLLERVMGSDLHQARKHGLNSPSETPEDYARRQVNAMDNDRLIDAIEAELEEWLYDRGFVRGN